PPTSPLFPYTTLFRSMETLGAKRRELRHIEVLEDVEQHQRGDALAVRRQLETIEATVVGRHRRLRLAAMAGEVLLAQYRAERPRSEEHTSELQSRFDL